MMKRLMIVTALFCLFSTGAEAARHHHKQVKQYCRVMVSGAWGACFNKVYKPTPRRYRLVHRHRTRTVKTHQQSPKAIQLPIKNIASADPRPRDCYGIAWCGCWLRHYFGLASTALNLARNWAGLGNPASLDNANVVVWNHHVALLLDHKITSQGLMLLITSGNDGNRYFTVTRWFPARALGGAIAYRRV